MSAAKKVWATYGLNLGRYNLAGNEKSWCLTLYTSAGNFSETWPEDEKPDTDGLLPSDVMDMLIERLDSYWIHTRRDEKKAEMLAWQKNAKQFDEAYLITQVANIEEKLKQARRRLQSVQDELADASEENA